MRRLTVKILDLLCDRGRKRYKPRQRPLVARPQVLVLEDRVMLSTTPALPPVDPLGTLAGQVFVDGNGNGVRDPGEAGVPGVQITLSGKTTDGTTITPLNVTTDATGAFAFRSLQPGTYQLSAPPVPGFLGQPTIGGLSETGTGIAVSGVNVATGSNPSQNIGIAGLAPDAFSLRELMPSTTPADFPFQPAGAQANAAPVVKTPIADVALNATTTSQNIDLAASLTDPNLGTSQVRFDTNLGSLTLNLFDSQAPQTVANFLDYVENHRYDATIFHRLGSLNMTATPVQVLQGGGFQLKADATNGFTFPTVAATNEPMVQNEFNASLPDTAGTIAMAKGTDPNSASSQFFFNLVDNSSALGSTNTGGFTVFGSVASDATSQATFKALQAATVTPETAANGAFNNLPLNNFTGTNFPKDATENNFLEIKDIVVLKQDEELKYTVVSNSNPALVSAAFVQNHSELLSVQAIGTQVGTATITVRATDQFGASVDTSFKVTVSH